MTELFENLPRTKRKVRMRVVDAGYGMIEFECWKCGHNTGWVEDNNTLTENRRGPPCPICNKGIDDD